MKDLPAVVSSAALTLSTLAGRGDEVFLGYNIMCFKPPLIPQHHRSCYLPIGDGPVGPQQPVFFLRRDQFKTVFLIKPHRPPGRSPGSHQDRLLKVGS